MAKRDFEIQAVENKNSYALQTKEEQKEAAPHAKGNVQLQKEPTLRRIKKAFIADEVTSVKEFALFDVVIPAIKRTFRDLLVNSLDITLGYGKSNKSPYQTVQNGSRTYVAYGSMSSGRYADDQPRKENHRDSAIIGPMELDRIKFCDFDEFGNIDLRQSKDSAIEALGYLMDMLEDGYDCVTVAQFLSYVSTKVNSIHVAPIHSKWGWYSLQGSSVIECSDGSGYYIRFPKPVPM